MNSDRHNVHYLLCHTILPGLAFGGVDVWGVCSSATCLAEHLFESLRSGARVQALPLRSFKDFGALIGQERKRSLVRLGALELDEVLGGSTEQC